MSGGWWGHFSTYIFGIVSTLMGVGRGGPEENVVGGTPNSVQPHALLEAFAYYNIADLFGQS